MDVLEALYTTRAMRRVRPDPIPMDVQAKILDAAIRAPSGGNTQDWRFLLVDDPTIKGQIGPLYRECMARLWSTIYAERIAKADADPDTAESRDTHSMVKSAQHLADQFEGVPLYLFGFVRMDNSGGSIFPAIWSAQLAARAEGVGSALTSILGVFRRQEVDQILGVPEGEGWNMACCVSFGYPTGRWGVAKRNPVDQVSFRNQWGSPLGLSIPSPLWSSESDE
jgi:nitroreductase